MPANSGRAGNVIKSDNIIDMNLKSEKALDVLEGHKPEELIFALDVGTRTVIGILGVQKGDGLKVLLVEVLEHKTRAMLDGQVHDIVQVASVAGEVKRRLEEKAGITMTKVAIAAAGRVLKTCEVTVERDTEPEREIDHEMISSMEIEGIQRAQLKLDEELAGKEESPFYCVGYTVVSYYLDGYAISSLLGHRGKRIGAKILATFLPHSVVDSLYAVMNNVGLEVASLTLEPIAAINVTIPKDLRLLNIALVDIGAGTSDIAITRDGGIAAYSMVPIAGDEITESISQHYLVDFNTAEKIKIALSSKKGSVSFKDILGKKRKVDVKDVLDAVEPTVELLAETIARKIVECNGKSPNAVFLIGGGSQIPGLTERVAKHLNIDKDRVAVRGKDVVQNVEFGRLCGKKLNGPEAITPLGIAVTAYMQQGQDFLSVTVNGRKLRLFNSRKLMVADALILIGFNPDQLIGRSGKSLTFELNGVKKIVRGDYGKAAEIYVNGEPANLETAIKPGDDITVIPAEEGKNAEAKVSDFVKNIKKAKVTLNGSVVDIGTKVYINGKAAEADSSISDGDVVQTAGVSTVGELADMSGLDTDKYVILVNGAEAAQDYELKDGDVVEYRLKHAVSPMSGFEQAQKQEKAFNPEQAHDGSMWVTVNGQKVVFRENKKQYIFVDVFSYIDFDLSKPQGSIVLKLNGKQAAFTDEVKQGDVIEIYWEK